MLERKGQKTVSLEQMDEALPGGAWDRVFQRAVQVMGSEDDAAWWMQEPAFGLPNRERPMDLMDTPEGVELIENYLEQIEHGVYI